MNIQAVIVEKSAGRPLMSGLHGCFSVGGFAGAGSVSLFLSLGLTPLATTGLVTIALITLLRASDRHNLRYGNEGGTRSPLFVLPRGIVLFIGLLCFICFLAEGAILDWSAEFLISERAVPHTLSGSAYTAFAVAMTAGRFGGDRIVAWLGRVRVMVMGRLLMAAGFALAIWAPGIVGALLGFLCIGLGASNIVPVLYRDWRADRDVAKPCCRRHYHHRLQRHTARTGRHWLRCQGEQPWDRFPFDCLAHLDRAAQRPHRGRPRRRRMRT